MAALRGKRLGGKRLAAASTASWCLGGILLAAVLTMPTAGHAQQAYTQPEARIIVTGDGSIAAAPDYARITSGVTVRGKTAKEATDTNSKLMTSVTAALVNAGIEQKDIRTSHFSLQPVYESTEAHGPAKLTGFSVSNQVTVTIRQIVKVGEILDRLVAAGATDAGTVEFLHSNLSQTLDNARTAAVADARRKADIYARAAGVTLGAIAWITEDSGYTPLASAAPRVMAARASVPISTGEDTLHVRITVGFDLAH
jgi:uncharacterized protein